MAGPLGAALGGAGPVTAPVPPGALGQASSAQELLTYLSELQVWLDLRRGELDRLDSAAQQAKDSASFTSDVVLAMSMWQSVSTSMLDLTRLWDSGRADALARERMSRLIWGRLDGASLAPEPNAGGRFPTSGLAGGGVGADPAAKVSLVEATRLSDALTAQLRTRLSFDAEGRDVVARLRRVRASLVRTEDLTSVSREPEAVAGLERIARTIDDLTAQAARGADISGRLAELEVTAARAERDSIVGTARRHEQERDRTRAIGLVEQLRARKDTLTELVERCRREIAVPPRLAVPDVTRLGDVPGQAAQLTAYLTRLEQVARAMDAVEDAYSEPLRTRASLRYRVEQAEATSRSNSRASSPTVAAGLAEARAAVDATPCDIALARDLTDQYVRLAQTLPHRQGGLS